MTKMFDVASSDAFRRLRETEKISDKIFYNALLHVPGLLQEPAYAQEAICGISGLRVDEAEAAGRVRERNERRAAFLARLERDDAPQVHVVIDENVLRRSPVGSSAMRGQIQHLIELSRKPSVHIGVMPLERGHHQGLIGPFEVHDTADGSVLFFETPAGDTLLDADADRIALYRDLVGSLMAEATSGDEARTLMTKLISG